MSVSGVITFVVFSVVCLLSIVVWNVGKSLARWAMFVFICIGVVYLSATSLPYVKDILSSIWSSLTDLWARLK